jgi:hypothetical protein
MSALLNACPKAANGSLIVTVGTLAPDHYSSGIPYEADGSLALFQGVADHYHQGLGFSATGRLCRQGADPTHFGSGAAPYPAGNSLGTIPGAPTHFTNGVGYSATNRLATT